MNNFTYSDELYHYGVLGMKWGVRRNPNYQYKSWGTKHNEKLASKMSKKLANPKLKEKKRQKLTLKKQQYEYRAGRSRTLDKRELAYAKRVKTGANIALRLFTNFQGAPGIGSKPYQQYMAMLDASDTIQSGKDVSDRALAYIGSVAFARLGSTITKGVYIRSGQPTNKKRG